MDTYLISFFYLFLVYCIKILASNMLQNKTSQGFDHRQFEKNWQWVFCLGHETVL